MKAVIARPARDWLLGALSGLLAVALRASLQPLLGDLLPFVVAFPATAVAASLWGTGAAALTAVVCALAVLVPGIAPALTPDHRPLQTGAFLLGSILIVMFCGRLGASRAAASSEPDAQVETPLTAWLRTVLWGALLVPGTAFVLIAWWGYERALDDATANVKHACDLVYEHARRTFEVTAEIAARADAVTTEPDATVRQREAEIHQRLADMTSGVPSVFNLNVWDANGRPLARSDDFRTDPSRSVADRGYFIEQRDKPQALGIGEIINGRQTGREVFNATIRRTSPDGSFNGVVAVSLLPSYFRDYYHALATEQPNLAIFALVRTDGVLIARWPPASAGRERTPASNPVLARIAANELSGTYDLAGPDDGATRIQAFRRLEGLPLYVVAGVSRRAVLVEWARFAALLGAIMLPIGAGLGYVTWVALQKTRREALTAAALRDQVERRARAEHSLLQAQKYETLAVVTGGVAHDFNNLLAVVTASLHVLKRRHPGLVEEKQIQAMTRAVQSGVRLTRQLLSFTRKQALRPENIALQTWLPANEALFRSTLGGAIAWRFDIAPDTPPVRVDAGELELALINLVVNARHAMPDGGTLTVTVGVDSAGAQAAGAQAAGAVIAVTDTGVGIAPELLEKVVEPFFTTRAKGVGSGLGLSQVQGFCTEAGGTLRLESRLGEGTTVRMLLPASGEAVAHEPPRPVELPTARGRVLLVEDHEDVGATTELLLRSAGLEVVRTLNADSALQYLDSAAPRPDIVLSDIAMPGPMNGIELAFKLAAQYPTLPVLLQTGYAEQLERAIAGGLRVLQKPVAPEDLMTELRALLDARNGP